MLRTCACHAPLGAFGILPALAVVISVMLGATLTRAQDADAAKILEGCRAMPDSAARLRCFENATSNLIGNRAPPIPRGSSPSAPVPAPAASAPMGAWHLVRTPNPGGGPEAVSVMHTADPSKSDPDLAGLMIRCAESAPEVLVVLITPFSPRAHPRVAIGGPSPGAPLEAKVVPPGASLLLPPQATALASGPWQALPELSVDVTDEGTAVRGVVPIDGLPAALATLTANCPAR